MCVVVSDDDQYFAYCKGSPEKLATICNNIPSNYQETLDRYSLKGLRILGMGYKKIDPTTVNSITRKDIECDLTFLGLLIFENPLKVDSRNVISNLMDSNIKCKIISGDNINTSIEVSRQISMIHDHSAVLILDYIEEMITIQILKNEKFIEEFQITTSSPVDSSDIDQRGVCEKIYKRFKNMKKEY